MPNFVSAKIPNDPFAERWFYTDIGAYKAWDLMTGSKDVVVAIIDNGFDANQPDIRNNVWKNTKEIVGNGIDDDNNGFIDDIEGWNFVSYDLNKNGKFESSEKIGNNNPIPDVSNLSQKDKDKGYFNHGTLVAGLIGAVGNNSKAGTGLNWEVRLMNLKVLENNGVGDFNPLYRAIYYAVDNGADVINISAIGDGSKELNWAIDYAYNHGVVVVAAAGNNSASLNENPLYPICNDAKGQLQKIIGVSAIDQAHRLAQFSNYGSNCVDITAPGVQIGSTLRYDESKNLSKLFSDGWNGTSFSTPLVSGAAALIKAVQSDWEAPQIYDALLKTAHHTPNIDEAGYKELFGVGLLQVDKAVQYAIDRLPVARSIKGFNRYSSVQGTFESIGFDDSSKIVKKPFLRKLSFVTTFSSGNQVYYLTKRIYKEDTLITVYDANWSQMNQFTLAGKDESKIFVDNFVEQKGLEVGFLNTTSSTITFYSLDGVKIKTQKFQTMGDVLAATVVSAKGNPLRHIAFLTRQENKNFITVYDSSGNIKQSLNFVAFKSAKNFAAGDFDSDKKTDFVILSNKGVNTTLSIIDSLGKIVTQFPVGSSADLSDMQMIVGDYNQDKRDDIMTFTKPYNDITVWKANGMIFMHKKLTSSLDPLTLIPSF